MYQVLTQNGLRLSFQGEYIIKNESVIVFDDWFLPSENELDAMYNNLKVYNVGNFSNDWYWSSTEGSWAAAARMISFTDGVKGNGSKENLRAVRAARSFVAAAEAYELRDTGPAGGLIFYIDGTTYYESSISNIATNQSWSNITSTQIGATAQGTSIGTGLSNSNAIVNQSGHIDSAAKLCLDYLV